MLNFFSFFPCRTHLHYWNSKKNKKKDIYLRENYVRKFPLQFRVFFNAECICEETTKKTESSYQQKPACQTSTLTSQPACTGILFAQLQIF